MREGEFLRLRPDRASAALAQVTDDAEAARLAALYGARNGYGPGVFESWASADAAASESSPETPALDGVALSQTRVAAHTVWAVAALVVIFVLALSGWWVTQGAVASSSSVIDRVAGGVAADQVQAYRIASTTGSAVDACVQAGVVKAAYLQAKSEPDYAHWTEVEREDCQRAGILRNLR